MEQVTDSTSTTNKPTAQQALALSTAGSRRGVEAEARLPEKQANEALEFMSQGLVVPLDGLHEAGAYVGDSAIVLRGSSLLVSEPAQKFARGIYRQAWGDGYQDTLRQMKEVLPPNNGNLMIEIESTILHIVGWMGSLDISGETYDMSDQTAEVVQGVLRDRLPRWWIHKDKKKGLPKYDPASVNMDFLNMLKKAAQAADEVSVFLIHGHLSREGSGTPFVVMHAGMPPEEEEKTEPRES